MKKNHLIVAAILGLFVSLIVTSCTDIPISYSTKIIDSRIFGYWQLNENEAVHVFKNADGSANIVEIDFDKDNHNWKKGKSKKIYFATISDNKSTDHFFSYKHDMYDSYVTAKFRFNSYNELVIHPLSHEFLKKYNETNNKQVVIFKTVNKFQFFVKNNKKYPALYDKGEGEKMHRKGSIQDLDRPTNSYTSLKQQEKKSKNLGIWVSPYGEQYVAFYDDGTIDRYLYYDNKSQWIGHNYYIDRDNQVIKVTKTSNGSLIANIYFTTDGRMIWKYMDINRRDMVYRKIGALKPDIPEDSIFSWSGTWTTKDGELILSIFPWNKSVIYRPYDRNLYETTHEINNKKISFFYNNSKKETYTYETINDNHWVMISSESGKSYDLYKERDTDKFNRGAEAAVSFLNLLFSSGNSNSNSSLSTDNYSGSSWLKNEHEREALDRVRGN